MEVVEMTPKEQLAALKHATLRIEQSNLLTEIRLIGRSRDRIVQGANAEDGNTVVECIEGYIPSFLVLANENSLLFEIIQTLNLSDTCSKVLPTFTTLKECLNEFSNLSSEKRMFEKVLNAQCGSVVNDYLQGKPLIIIENVANACAKFETVVSHVDEMVMLMEDEALGK